MTVTPISLMSRFESGARKDFEARLAEVRREYMRYLATVPAGGDRFDVRELAAELMTMPDMERFTLLRHVVPNTDGPKTLEGLEALRSFIANYMLDDSECIVVPEPDAKDLVEDPYFTASLDSRRFDPDNEGLSDEQIRALALEDYAARERPMVVVQAWVDNRAARAEDLMVAIRHNREMEARRDAAYAEFAEPDEDEAGPRP